MKAIEEETTDDSQSPYPFTLGEGLLLNYGAEALDLSYLEASK